MVNTRTKRSRRKSKCVGRRRRPCKSAKKCKMTNHRKRKRHCRTTVNRLGMKRLRSLRGGGRRRRRTHRRRRNRRGGGLLAGTLAAAKDLLLPFTFFTLAQQVRKPRKKSRRRPRRSRSR